MLDKFNYQLQKFLRTHDALGWFIVMIGVSLIAQFVIYVLLSIIFGDEGKELFYTALTYIAMPASLQDGITRPWSIFTWPFVSLAASFHYEADGLRTGGLEIFRFLISGYILYAFGRIGQQLLGSERLRRFILLCIPVIGILVMILGSFVYTGAESAPAITYLSGMMPLVIALIVVTATLVPDYPIQMFLFGTVKLKWLALVFVVLEFVMGQIFTPFSWAVFFAAGFAIIYVNLMRQGTDIVEVVAGWFRKKEQIGSPSPSPKPSGAKVRSMKMRSSTGPQRSTISDDGPIPQEEVDRILDKINEEGYESLTRQEKERLLRASEDKKK